MESLAPEAAWRRLSARRAAGLVAGVAVLALCVTLDVATGPAMLAPATVAHSLLGLAADPMVDAIVWAIRLPVALMAVAVGAALGVTGAVMQTVLNNPLASSYTVGISAGAGFGAALVIVLGAGLPVAEAYAVPVSAFVFAALACACVWLLGGLRGATAETLVLAGIALMFLFQALLALLQFMASPEALQQIVFWLFGSLQRATWAKLGVVVAILAAVAPLLARDAWALTALRLGEDRAAALGIGLRGLRLRALAVVAIATGAAVAFVGTIGFIGLVAPHLARMLMGEDQRWLLPGAALAGALLLSAASVASKTVAPGAVIPIGIVTALVGVPFFAWLVVASRRARW
ncbi:FecCD family ABC transporter permease [Neoroseomonas oryzicola]|uniref:Iron ABC transporter permease n=1 Tax=Neoroseomonas oryzicola TaxID=535904 RepID=A0A9X9WI33_9PROT|nr:iron ABC transporter permease [Neoroseomonas oryzicola]MBR0659993.1 iron ABC transporter permease [Neoroseomonas oryzicola]NKE19455.1 iron ABC transporter permease [Neoroseomonas oryzicola]